MLDRKTISYLFWTVLLFLTLLAAYSNHFHNAFHFDDAHTIQNNLFIRDLANIPRFFRDATTFSANPMNQSYRPIVSTTLAIDYRLGKGLSPFYFHISTFLFFIAQGGLMFLLFRKVYARTAPGPAPDAVALFAVAWYLLHPANAETINYVIARGDSISTFFIVLTALLYLAPRARRHYLYLLPAALGILTKPVAAVFPLLLFTYEMLYGDTAPGDGTPQWKGRLARWSVAIRAVAPAIFTTVALMAFIGVMSPKTWTPGGSSRFGYMITQPFVMLYYAGTFFFPLWLSADTDWGYLGSLSDPRFLVGAAFLALLVWISVAAAHHREWRPVSFGLWWFLIALVPTSFVFPLAEVMNDHRVFLPYVGLVMAVAWTAALLLDRLRKAWPMPRFDWAVPLGAMIILAGYAYGTHQRNKVWHTEETLWRDVTLKSPKNGRGWMNYGLTQMSKGAYPAAESAFLKALKFTPNYSYLHINLGVLKASMGKPAEAETWFVKALALDGGKQPNPYAFYGRFLMQQKRQKEAIPLFRRAMELSPADIGARHQLMTAYEQVNDLRAFDELAEETLRIDPNDTVAKSVLATAAARRSGQPWQESASEQTPEDLLNLSLQHYRADDFKGCIQAAEDALRLRSDYAPAFNNICAAWCSLGEWDKAAAAGERAVALDPGSALAKNNLAWAKSRRGAQH